MNENEDTCENCRFFTPSVCRLNPPMVIALSNEYDNGVHAATAWPEILRGDWCGQWEGEVMSEEDAILLARKAPRGIG